MEKQFSRFSVLSLQEIALRKVTVLLWSETHTLVSVQNVRIKNFLWDNLHYWHEVESQVSSKLSKLQLHASVEEQIKRIIKPIGLQIMHLISYHKAYLNSPHGFFSVPALEKLNWTAAGMIEYGKTAEELVKCNVFDIVNRYKLACLYCLDQYIPGLWKELPQENKKKFYNEDGVSRITEPILQYCWPYILKGEEHKLKCLSEDPISFNQFAFQRSSFDGNETAVKYFLQKLSREEREASLVSAAKSALDSPSMYLFFSGISFPRKNICEVVCYLLSLMTPEQQIEIFKERPADVLECFLDWPRHDAFLDISDAMWTWMECEDLRRRARNYDTLLDKLVKSNTKHLDYSSPDLFRNFFPRCPSSFKKRFVDNECWFAPFFSDFLNTKDTTTINVILSNLDAEDRLRLVSSQVILDLFYLFISADHGVLVERCLRGTGLSNEDKVSLKEAFMGLLNEDSGRMLSETPKWKKFFEFLDETDMRVQITRSSVDQTLTEAKENSVVKK